MKPSRWTDHALQNLTDSEIERDNPEQTVEQPIWIIPDPPDRQIWMRRYFDSHLQQEMLLRVVVEEMATEIVIVTLYKTSQFRRYLKGLQP